MSLKKSEKHEKKRKIKINGFEKNVCHVGSIKKLLNS